NFFPPLAFSGVTRICPPAMDDTIKTIKDAMATRRNRIIAVSPGFISLQLDKDPTEDDGDAGSSHLKIMAGHHLHGSPAIFPPPSTDIPPTARPRKVAILKVIRRLAALPA